MVGVRVGEAAHPGPSGSVGEKSSAGHVDSSEEKGSEEIHGQ